MDMKYIVKYTEKTSTSPKTLSSITVCSQQDVRNEKCSSVKQSNACSSTSSCNLKLWWRVADLVKNFGQPTVCLSAARWPGQWVARPWGSHKYCVRFHFLYALPWAQLSISGQFLCPKGGLTGSADLVHKLPICLGLSFIHPLENKNGQLGSFGVKTTLN